MDTVLLTGLLALVSKNLVEMLKHLANVGGAEDTTYTPLKGLYTLAAPVLLAVIAVVAQTQGVNVDLLGELGVTGGDDTSRAIFTAILAGFAAPEAYDAQGLLKAKVSANNISAAVEAKALDEPATDAAGDPIA